MHISVNNMKIFYEDQGQGYPILLLHGFPLDHQMWRNQAGALKQHYRVITPDLAGMGQSDVPDENITLDYYADQILALLDYLHIEKAVLGGFSMGGYIVFSLLRKAPDKFPAVILSNTRPEADTREGRKNRMNMSALLFENGSSTAKDAMIPKLLSEQTLQENSKLIDELSSSILSMNPDGLVHASLAMAYRKDSTEYLNKIQVPTLVIAGEQDAVTPPDVMKKMSDQIPHAHYRLIPGAAHLTPMEDPDAYNGILLEFLKEHASK